MRAAGLFRVVPALAAMVPLSATTFTRDIAPILYKHCATCHHPNDIAPMPLLNYKQVRPWAASIKEAALSRKMPPWKADPRVGKWSPMTAAPWMTTARFPAAGKAISAA